MSITDKLKGIKERIQHGKDYEEVQRDLNYRNGMADAESTRIEKERLVVEKEKKVQEERATLDKLKGETRQLKWNNRLRPIKEPVSRMTSGMSNFANKIGENGKGEQRLRKFNSGMGLLMGGSNNDKNRPRLDPWGNITYGEKKKSVRYDFNKGLYTETEKDKHKKHKHKHRHSSGRPIIIYR